MFFEINLVGLFLQLAMMFYTCTYIYALRCTRYKKEHFYNILTQFIGFYGRLQEMNPIPRMNMLSLIQKTKIKTTQKKEHFYLFLPTCMS